MEVGGRRLCLFFFNTEPKRGNSLVGARRNKKISLILQVRIIITRQTEKAGEWYLMENGCEKPLSGRQWITILASLLT